MLAVGIVNDSDKRLIMTICNLTDSPSFLCKSSSFFSFTNIDVPTNMLTYVISCTRNGETRNMKIPDPLTKINFESFLKMRKSQIFEFLGGVRRVSTQILHHL